MRNIAARRRSTRSRSPGACGRTTRRTSSAYFATGGTGYTNWNNQVTAAGSGLPGAATDVAFTQFAIGQWRHGAHHDHVAGAQRRCAAHLCHPSRRRQQRRAMNASAPTSAPRARLQPDRRHGRHRHRIDRRAGDLPGIRRLRRHQAQRHRRRRRAAERHAVQFHDGAAVLGRRRQYRGCGRQPRCVSVRQRHQGHAAADSRADHRQRLGCGVRHLRRQLRCFRAHGHAHQLQLGADDRPVRGLRRAESAGLQDQRRHRHDEQRFEWRGQVRDQHRHRPSALPTATAMSRSSTPRLPMPRCSPATRC